MKWLCCMLCIFAPFVSSQQKRSDTIAALVNEDMITYGDVYEKVKIVINEIEASDLPSNQKEKLKERHINRKLQDMVDRLLIQQEAKKYKLKLPDKGNIKKKVQKELKKRGETRGLDAFALEDIYYSRELLRQLFQAKSAYSQKNEQRAIVDTFVLPMEMRQYYKDNVTNYTKPGKIKTRIITLFFVKNAGREQTQTKGEAIVKEIRGGADFSEMAKLYSNDPYAESGGDWPRVEKEDEDVWDFIAKGEGLTKEVQDVAFTMKKGEVSDPIMLNYESQIVKVVGIEERRQVPFSDVQEDIRRKIQNEKVVRSLIRITEKLRATAYIWPENLFDEIE